MLFGRIFEDYGLLAWLRRLRKRRLEAYAIVLLAVALATLVRAPLMGPLSDAAHFTTYGLAIIVSALVCGFWPGMLAVLLSVLTGWFLFLPPMFSFELPAKEAWTLSLFALVASINVALVSGLVAALLRHEARQLLLFRELQHRSNNLFAVIQTIASRTLIEGQTISDAKEVFARRLHALARTHAMLAKNAFLGASLKEIMREDLPASLIRPLLRGVILPSIPVRLNFTLIIHELLTNAVKYGALSTREGRVDIHCSMDGANEGQLRFVWRESGGPLIASPTRKGFGSAVLLEVAKQFSKDVQAKYEPTGLTYQLRLLLSAIEAPRVEIAPLVEAATTEGATDPGL